MEVNNGKWWRARRRASERKPTKQEMRQYKNADRDRRRAEYHEMKSAPCADCKTKFDPVCMDFDHRPGEVKLFTISRMALTVGRAKLATEIAKCDLVCANCHRLRTKTRA